MVVNRIAFYQHRTSVCVHPIRYRLAHHESFRQILCLGCVSQGVEHEGCTPLWYDTILLWKLLPTFRRNLLSSSPGRPKKNTLLVEVAKKLRNFEDGNDISHLLNLPRFSLWFLLWPQASFFFWFNYFSNSLYLFLRLILFCLKGSMLFQGIMGVFIKCD